MKEQVLAAIRSKIHSLEYDLKGRVAKEVCQGTLSLSDFETAVTNGRIVRIDEDPEGARYTVYGTSSDGFTPVGFIGRFTGTGRYLVTEAYKEA
jgi:hypothetical protein